MLNIIAILTSGSFFLLAFIVAINPRKVNIVANRWLAVFVSRLMYGDKFD